MHGLLIAFEGLDQSGKQTQAERLRDRLEADGRRVRLLSFPAYDTPIGKEIRHALDGSREWPADVMQLLYIANRYEAKPDIERTLSEGTIIVCDRYVASSIAYGESQDLDPTWLRDLQRFLPQPHLTVLLDIAPEASARRKLSDRDKYERDFALLSRVRGSYLRQSEEERWVRLDADRDRAAVAEDVFDRVRPLLQARASQTTDRGGDVRQFSGTYTGSGTWHGTYTGSGTWHDAVGKSGHYRIQHTHAASADGFEVSFTHKFDDGTVVDAHFTMKWIAPSLFAVLVAGTQVGNGYVFEDFFQYHLKIGDKFVQVGYRQVDDHLRVFGSSSTNAEGHYTAWAERLLRTPA